MIESDREQDKKVRPHVRQLGEDDPCWNENMAAWNDPWLAAAPTFRRWLARAGASEDVADDLVQECYLKAIHCLLAEIGKPHAFLWSMLRNALIDFRRRAKRESSIQAIEEEGVEFADENEGPAEQAMENTQHAAKLRVYQEVRELGLALLDPMDWKIVRSYLKHPNLAQKDWLSHAERVFRLEQAEIKERFVQAATSLHDYLLELSDYQAELRSDMALLDLLDDEEQPPSRSSARLFKG